MIFDVHCRVILGCLICVLNVTCDKSARRIKSQMEQKQNYEAKIIYLIKILFFSRHISSIYVIIRGI